MTIFGHFLRFFDFFDFGGPQRPDATRYGLGTNFAWKFNLFASSLRKKFKTVAPLLRGLNRVRKKRRFKNFWKVASKKTDIWTAIESRPFWISQKSPLSPCAHTSRWRMPNMKRITQKLWEPYLTEHRAFFEVNFGRFFSFSAPAAPNGRFSKVYLP